MARGESHPFDAAICADGETISYLEFAEKIRRFAASFSAVPGPCVLIALPQGVDAYAAMFGALLAGGYYAPVNIATPVAKLRHMVSVLRPDFIVSAAALADLSGHDGVAAVHVDPSRLPAAALSGRGTPHKIAYVIFTSGSTGIPKGVIIPRVALNCYVSWVRSEFGIGSGDRVSQNSNIGFDLSVLEIYGCLCGGATLVPVSSHVDRLLPAAMARRERLSVWISVPSCITLMMNARQVSAEYLGTVRTFIHCGEPLLPEHVRAIFQACPEAVVYNTYGPTEATVSMTCNRLTARDYEDECHLSVALGPAIRGMDMVLVGPTRDEGEIVIVGPQVALGYLNDKKRTKQSFRPVSIDESPRMGYYTGDWAVRRNGRLFFRQRYDRQIKVRGFRIELDEIEAAIRNLGWLACCVFKWKNTLVAVVEKNSCPFDAARIRRQLRESLEDYKIPPYVTEIDAMPRNENDKLDVVAVETWFAEVGRLSVRPHSGRDPAA